MIVVMLTTEDVDRFPVGTRVRVERDEALDPSAGTWSRYRGRAGVVVTLNVMDGEIGVAWTPGKDLTRTPTDSWFRAFELGPIAGRSGAGDVRNGTPAGRLNGRIDQDDGAPKPHSRAWIVQRLRELGYTGPVSYNVPRLEEILRGITHEEDT